MYDAFIKTGNMTFFARKVLINDLYSSHVGIEFLKKFIKKTMNTQSASFTVKHGYIEYAFNKYSNIDFITLFLKKSCTNKLRQ